MAQPHDSFWELERKNRRETALLVVVFILLFTALGCGLDFVFGNLRIIDGQITGCPLLTVIALANRIDSVGPLVLWRRGAGAGLRACAAVAAGLAEATDGP